MREITVVSTEQTTGRRLEARPYRANPGPADAQITVDPATPCQEILGFGGAFTTSAAAALEGLSPKTREEALRAYFHPRNGIGYTMGRVHIGCSDFSAEEYSLLPGGASAAEHLDFTQDEHRTIPLIRHARRLMEEELLLYAVPWSPPAWMKSNGTLNGGGHLLPEHYGAMADLFVRFLTAYRERGVPIWAVGAQNEPDEIQRWASCLYTAGEEAAFLKTALIPALDRAGFADTGILFWDSNKDKVHLRAGEILADPALRARVTGAAFHWYSGDFFGNLEQIHREHPGTLLISTESCTVLPRHWDDWSIGERYGHEIIGDMNHWCSAFIDWNLFLDGKGGPNLHRNFCAAPVMAAPGEDRLLYLSSYYYIGQFSRFVRRGARRLPCGGSEDGPEAAAFQNPDGGFAAVVMNRRDESCRLSLKLGEEALSLELPAHSIHTVLL